jgi:hypothetical protein
MKRERCIVRLTSNFLLLFISPFSITNTYSAIIFSVSWHSGYSRREPDDLFLSFPVKGQSHEIFVIIFQSRVPSSIVVSQCLHFFMREHLWYTLFIEDIPENGGLKNPRLAGIICRNVAVTFRIMPNSSPHWIIDLLQIITVWFSPDCQKSCVPEPVDAYNFDQ